MNKETKLIIVAVAVGFWGIGFFSGAWVTKGVYNDPMDEPAMPHKPDQMEKEFERIHRELDEQDSIFRAEHPEYDTIKRHIDWDDEDMPIIQHWNHPSDPIEAPGRETR